MSWLAIDTATDRASVALGRSADAALEENLDGARQHASALLPMIERLLAAAGTGLASVRGVILADGPGSFTGLRVGASVAKALAHARGLPLFTAPSLMARAYAAAGGRATPVVVASDALRGEVYAAVYRFGDSVETILSPRVVSRGAVALLAPADAIEAHAEARATPLIALAALPGGARPIADVEAWEPAYGRPAEAQARWEHAHGRSLSGAAGLAG